MWQIKTPRIHVFVKNKFNGFILFYFVKILVNYKFKRSETIRYNFDLNYVCKCVKWSESLWLRKVSNGTGRSLEAEKCLILDNSFGEYVPPDERMQYVSRKRGSRGVHGWRIVQFNAAYNYNTGRLYLSRSLPLSLSHTRVETSRIHACSPFALHLSSTSVAPTEEDVWSSTYVFHSWPLYQPT